MISMAGLLKRERRSQERVPGRCDIEFSSGTQTYTGTSSNFSLRGLFVRTPNHLEPETIVAITLHLPDGSKARLTGRVTRIVKALPVGDLLPSLPYKEQGGMAVDIIEKDPPYLEFVTSFRTRVLGD